MDYSAQNVGTKKIRNYCTEKLLDNILISYEFNVKKKKKSNKTANQTRISKNIEEHQILKGLKERIIQNLLLNLHFMKSFVQS